MKTITLPGKYFYDVKGAGPTLNPPPFSSGLGTGQGEASRVS